MRSRWAAFVVLGAAIIGVGLLWKLTPLADIVQPAQLAAQLEPPWRCPVGPCGDAGALLNAAAVYFAGAKIIRGRAERSFGEAIARVRNGLQARGVIAIAMSRKLPVAPFSLVNVAAGSIGVPFRDFISGTAPGLAPGIVLICLFGHELKDLLRDPSLGRVLTVVGIAVAWVLLSLAIQRFVARRGARA